MLMTDIEDTNRTDPPDEPHTMPEPRFSKMPDTSIEKQEVILKCFDGGYSAFNTLMPAPDIVMVAFLSVNLPQYGDKELSKYTIQQAESCIKFVKALNKRLEQCVDEMDINEINDLFLEAL